LHALSLGRIKYRPDTYFLFIIGISFLLLSKRSGTGTLSKIIQKGIFDFIT